MYVCVFFFAQIVISQDACYVKKNLKKKKILILHMYTFSLYSEVAHLSFYCLVLVHTKK